MSMVARMLKGPFGIILLAGALLVAGLVGIVTFWGVLPRTSNTSPLAALFFLMSSGTKWTDLIDRELRGWSQGLADTA